MTTDRPEDPIPVDGLPPEEDVSQAEVAEGVRRDPEEQKNFTEEHPEKARGGAAEPD